MLLSILATFIPYTSKHDNIPSADMDTFRSLVLRKNRLCFLSLCVQSEIIRSPYIKIILSKFIAIVNV